MAKARHQGLVVTKLMDPAQCQQGRERIELRRIVAEQQIHNRVSALGSVGRDRQSIFHALAQLTPQFGQMLIKEGVKLFFRESRLCGQHTAQLVDPLAADIQLSQESCCHVIELEAGISSPQQDTQVASSVFAGSGTIEGIQLVAQDVTMLVGSIDSCPRTVQMLPWGAL